MSPAQAVMTLIVAILLFAVTVSSWWFGFVTAASGMVDGDELLALFGVFLLALGCATATVAVTMIVEMWV